MDIYLDEHPVQCAFAPGESLEDGLRRVHEQFGDADRIIVGVKCDGVHLLDQQLQDALVQPIGRFRCIEVMTSRPKELAVGALREASKALADVDGQRVELASLFSSGRTTDGMESLSRMLGVWQQVHDVVIKSLHVADIDADACRIDGAPINECLDEPRRQLVLIRDALGARDYVQLADVLEYEFGEAVQSWQRLIDHVRARCEEDPDADAI